MGIYMSNASLENKYNVLVIGKTGVGKSTFINYLYGKEVAKTGTGKPQTERGFHKYHSTLGDNNLPTVLYDSWGLEADKYREWMDRFQNELQEHGVEKPATEWFHSVFYVIGGSGHRVEPADISIIKMLRDDKYCVNVIVNKADSLSHEQESALKDAIIESVPTVAVIFVASGGEDRRGQVEPFGREEVARQAVADFFDSLMLRLPLHVESIIEEWKEEWRSQVEARIQGVGRDDEKEVAAMIEEETERDLEKLMEKLGVDVGAALDAYGHVYSSFESIAPRSVKMDMGAGDGIPLSSWISLPLFYIKRGISYLFNGKENNRNKLSSAFASMEKRVDRELKKWVRKLEKSLKQMKSDFYSKRLAHGE